MPDIDLKSIGISLLITVLVVFLVWFFLLKPSGETADQNIVKIQTDIDTLNKSLSKQNVDIGDVVNNLIPTNVSNIQKLIDSTNASIKTQSAELSKSILDLKNANDALSKSTTSSVIEIKKTIGDLQTALNNLVKSQASEIKRLEDKSILDVKNLNTRIDELAKSEAGQTKLMKDTIDKLTASEAAQTILINSRIDGLTASEAAQTTLMQSQIDRILNNLFPGIRETIDGLIAQEKSNFNALSLKFPEIKSTIDAMKFENDTNLQKLKEQLSSNSLSDKEYQGSVDLIKSYIENALKSPEIADRVKNKIFSQDDYGKKVMAIKVEKEGAEYIKTLVMNRLKSYDCFFADSNSLNAQSLILVNNNKNKNVTKINDEDFEVIWANLLFNVLTKETYNSDNDTIDLSKLDRMPSADLIKVASDLRPVKNNIISYNDAKSATKQILNMYTYDCKNWDVYLTKMFNQDRGACSQLTSWSNFMKDKTQCLVLTPNNIFKQIKNLNVSDVTLLVESLVLTDTTITIKTSEKGSEGRFSIDKDGITIDKNFFNLPFKMDTYKNVKNIIIDDVVFECTIDPASYNKDTYSWLTMKYINTFDEVKLRLKSFSKEERIELLLDENSMVVSADKKVLNINTLPNGSKSRIYKSSDDRFHILSDFKVPDTINTIIVDNVVKITLKLIITNPAWQDFSVVDIQFV